MSRKSILGLTSAQQIMIETFWKDRQESDRRPDWLSLSHYLFGASMLATKDTSKESLDLLCDIARERSSMCIKRSSICQNP